MASVNTVSTTTPEGTTDDVLSLSSCSSNAYRLANLISIAGTYTFTVWAKAAAAMSVEFRVLGYVFTDSITTSWQKLEHTVETSSTTYIDICPGSDSALYLYKGKLEQGNIATDWTPSPDDVSSNITELQEQYSEIKQTATSITSTVTDIQKTLVYYVNRNYALMSGDYALGDDVSWYFTSTSAANNYTISTQDGYTRIYCDTSATASYTAVVDLSEDFDPSVQHTISFKIRASSAVAQTLSIRYKTSSTSSSYSSTTKSLASSNFTAGEWSTLSYTFTPTSSYYYTQVGFTLTNVRTADMYFDIAYIMVEQGDTAHDWEPAPEDGKYVNYVTKTNTSQIEQLANSISLCVMTDEDTGYLRLGSGDDGTVKFTIEADNITLDESGDLALKGNLTVTDYIEMSNDETAYIKGPTRVRFASIVYGECGFVAHNSATNGYYVKDTSENNVGVLWMSTGDEVGVGSSDYVTRIYGSSLYYNGYPISTMQHGNVSVTISASTATSFSVTFDTEFQGTPDVVITPRHNSNASTAPVCKIMTVSSTGFTGYLYDTSARTYVVHWIAMY